MTREAESAREHGLRRELRFWEAIALSIGIMAPGAAMALNGTLPASLVGRAVPLAFLFASVGILFVSYAFIRLTGYFNHAGSVYALSGVTLGPRAGFFSGWAPVVALAILVYVIYANVYPVPDFPFNIFPYVVAAWLVLGLGIVLLVPGLARRIGANLAEREGLAIEESTIP